MLERNDKSHARRFKKKRGRRNKTVEQAYTTRCLNKLLTVHWPFPHVRVTRQL